MQYEKVTLTTDASGDCTAYTQRPISGELMAIWLDNGAGGSTLTNTADIVVTDRETGAAVLTVTNLAADGWYAPRIPVYGTDGTPILHAAAGTPEVEEIPINGGLKFVVAQGGNAKTGYAHVYTEDE